MNNDHYNVFWKLIETGMPQFIKLAEDVYSHIIKEHSFKGELIQDLFEIQIALKTLIKDTEYELKHDWINFEDVILHKFKDWFESGT